MLRRVAGLNVAATSFVGFDFDYVFPQTFVASQSLHDRRVTLRFLWMTRARVMLFENRVMNDRRRHLNYSGEPYARL